MTIAVNATTDCSVQGAICNGAGGMLSGGVEMVAPGPSSQYSAQENSADTGAPTISDTAQVGETLADDTEIDGATGSTYTLVAADEGKVRVRARYENSNGPWSDEEEIKVLWEYFSPFFVFHQVQGRISRYATILGHVGTNYVPRDSDPSTVDLAVRADVVDTAGRSWNYCEQDGMGVFQNRYIIDDLVQAFFVHYGSSVSDCSPGDYYISYVVKHGTEFERVGTAPFVVGRGPVALVGAQSLDGMPVN